MVAGEFLFVTLFIPLRCMWENLDKNASLVFTIKSVVYFRRYQYSHSRLILSVWTNISCLPQIKYVPQAAFVRLTDGPFSSLQADRPGRLKLLKNSRGMNVGSWSSSFCPDSCQLSAKLLLNMNTLWPVGARCTDHLVKITVDHH